MENGYVRKYLSVSTISMLGSCETKVTEILFKPRPPTQAMKAGAAAHEKVAAALPKITKEDIVKQIKAFQPLQVRELPVYDAKTKICGRIDQLDMTGMMENGRNTGIIIDDKYPSNPDFIHGLTLYYKLQLSSYAVALENSDTYGNICSAVGAKLRYLQKGTNALIKEYDINRQRLEDCKANVPIASKVAWVLYERRRPPEHRRFDVESGNWTNCFCGSGITANTQRKLTL